MKSAPSGDRPARPGAPSGFFWKLFLSYCGVVALSTGIIGWLVHQYREDREIQRLADAVTRTAHILAATEAANPAHLWSERLEDHIREVAQETGSWIVLTRADGALLADSHGFFGPGARLAERPEFIAARRQQATVDRTRGPGLTSWLVGVSPILVQNEHLGYVRVGLPLAGALQAQRQLGQQVLLGAFVSALAAIGVGWFAGRQATRPLRRLAEACSRLAAGDFSQQIPDQARDEFGLVARTFNRMVRDVRERVAAQEREQARLAVLLRSLSDGVVALDAEGRITFVNQRALALVDPTRDRDALVGRRVQDWARAAAIRRTLQMDRDLPAPGSGECRLEGPGRSVHVHIQASFLPAEAAGRPGLLIVLHDITEIRRLERARKDFMANLSHELKTPIAAVGALIDTVLDDPTMDAETRQRFLDRIRRQNQRLSGLVRDLMTLARLETAETILDRNLLEPSETLKAVRLTFGPVARRRGIRLGLLLPDGPLYLAGDAQALEIAVNNLVANAIQHGAAGDRIDLVLAAEGAESVVIQVRDTGPGIPEEQRERIFERFYRVDPARDRGRGGAGLGLAIVKHLTLGMGGAVQAENRPEGGACFTLWFPRVMRPDQDQVVRQPERSGVSTPLSPSFTQG
ncbi:MAG: ATP-binding protein [Opitutales bacterium]